MNKGIHFLDILLWTLGRVEAAAGTIGPIATSTEVEDTGSAILRFRSGVIGSFTATDAVDAAPMWRVEIHGSHGGAVLEDGHFSFWRTRDGYQEPEMSGEDLLLDDQQRAKLLFGTGHVKQLMDFVEGIKVGRPPTVPAEDGRHATAVLEAIYRSSATGGFEEVETAR
jgi:predicted dehydrogenase